MKEQRWYEIDSDGVAHVYDAPYPANSLSESLVWPKDLAYYRSRFDLQKVWTKK